MPSEPSPFQSRNADQVIRHHLVWDLLADDPVKFTKILVPVKNKQPTGKRSSREVYHALCDLEDHAGNLGLSVLRSSGGKLQNKIIVSKVTGGAAHAWNQSCAPEEVIKRGDHLVKVNDVRTSDGAWTNLPGTVAVLTLRRPRVFIVRWRKIGKPLGLQVKKLDCLSWGIRVCSVRDGLVRDWNELSPSEAVVPSDVIVGINGITDDPQQLENLINSPTVEQLEVTVYSWRRAPHNADVDEVRLHVREETGEVTEGISITEDTTEVTLSEDPDENEGTLCV